MAKKPTSISDEDMPRFVRRCFDRYRVATEDIRKAREESTGFYIGGDLQWPAGDAQNRRANGRPVVTVNRLKPAVDQVVNESIQNPPGPQIHPIGDGADKDGADIQSGLIREVEYRSNAKVAYKTSMKNACAGGEGCIEITTNYVSDRSMEQELWIREVQDMDSVFIDPNAQEYGRQDARWGGKIRVLSRDQYIEEFGANRNILKRGMLDSALGWMQGALQDTFRGLGLEGWYGWSNQGSINMWTGGGANEGPYYICEFYYVTHEMRELTLYSDNILRFDNEEVPSGVTPKENEDGNVKRQSPKRVVTKYVVDAIEMLRKTEWPGTMIPYFWLFGPEMYHKGKLHRQSLITNGQDPNRMLNYSMASIMEIIGAMTRTPWVGWLGQFDIPNAQRGSSPWYTSNQEVHPFLEVNPVWAAPPDGGGPAQLLPFPQKNTWEAPVSRLLEVANFAGEAIKGATSVFFEPSINSAQAAQSGSAIKALQQQSNIGTVNWQEAQRDQVALMYREMGIIFPKIYDGPRVRTIVKPDNSHEIIEINREFPEGTPDEEKKKNNSITGRYAYYVTAGPSFETRNDESIAMLTDVLKIAPNLAQIPGFIGRFVKLVGQGNPIVEQMADSISPPQNGQVTPEQIQGLLSQEQQKNQVLMAEMQKLSQVVQQKQIESKTKIETASIAGLASIRAAEIKAGVDKADIDTRAFESMIGMAHDAASDHMDREHEANLQQLQQQHAIAQQQLAGQQAQEQSAQESQQQPSEE